MRPKQDDRQNLSLSLEETTKLKRTHAVSGRCDGTILLAEQGDISGRFNHCTSGPLPRRWLKLFSVCSCKRHFLRSSSRKWVFARNREGGSRCTVCESKPGRRPRSRLCRLIVFSGQSRIRQGRGRERKLKVHPRSHSPPSPSLPRSRPPSLLVRGERLGTSFAFINITLADRVIFRNQAGGECHL